MRKSIRGALMFILAFGSYQSLQAEVEIGEPVPDLSLKDTQDKEHSLSDFEGKHIVLEWTNYECPFVKKHYKNGDMQALQKKYTGQGVVWLSICSSAPGKQGYFPGEEFNERIEKQKAAPTAVLLDEDGEVGREYGAKTTPHMFVIDPEGNLIYQGAIDSIKSTDPDDVKKADNYVSACLDAALGGKPVKISSTQPYGCSVKY